MDMQFNIRQVEIKDMDVEVVDGWIFIFHCLTTYFSWTLVKGFVSFLPIECFNIKKQQYKMFGLH